MKLQSFPNVCSLLDVVDEYGPRKCSHEERVQSKRPDLDKQAHAIRIGSDTSMHVHVTREEHQTLLVGLNKDIRDPNYYNHCDRVLAMLSSVVMYGFAANCRPLRNITLADSRVREFDGIFELTPSDTFFEMAIYGIIEPYVVLVGFYYVQRLIDTNRFLVTHQNLRRVFFIAVMIAERFCHDESVSWEDKSFCSVAQFSFPLYVKLQILFLELIDWRLVYDESHLCEFRAEIISMIRPIVEHTLFGSRY